MAIRRRPGMYENCILQKRRKYVGSGRCIDCGAKSKTFRCDKCNDAQNGRMREWRKKNADYLAIYNKEWRKNNKDKIKLSNMKAQAAQYGMTLDEYADVKKTPCGICGEIKTKMVVDHCHKTNKVRGVLCSPCNSQLGWYEKNKDSINKWIEYQGRK